MKFDRHLARLGVSLSLVLGASAAGAQIPLQIEGYGAVTQGGNGGEVYRVTSLADGGPGTLRHGVETHEGRPRVILFDVGGTITLMKKLAIRAPNLTIDGSSAPSPGITIRQNTFLDGFVIAGTSDVIVRYVRVRGTYVDGGPTGGQNPTVVIDGDSGPNRIARRIVLDHVTISHAGDSAPDIWGPAEDVTIQYCFFYSSLHPTTVSGPGVRRRISMHHNVYAANGERNPQLRGDVRELDYVNNVVYGWGSMTSLGSGYGIRIRNEPGEPQVQANIINNAIVARPNQYPAWGLVYGSKPSPEASDGSPASPASQGTLVTSSRMGPLFVAGNILPKENQEHYSTVPAPFPAPPVTTFRADELKDKLLPYVGPNQRTEAEQALLDEIAAALAGRPAPSPTPLPTPGPTPSPSPTPGPNPTPTPGPGPTPTPGPGPTPTPGPHPTPGPVPTPRPHPQPTPHPNPHPTAHPHPKPTHGPLPMPHPPTHVSPGPIGAPHVSPSAAPTGIGHYRAVVAEKIEGLVKKLKSVFGVE